MENPSEPRVRRGQHDGNLPFKLAVVSKVARSEWSCKVAQRRYGTQGRSTGLTWYRKATHFASFEQIRRAAASRLAAMDQTPEQHTKQLGAELREQKHVHVKQVWNEQCLNLRLRTLL